jgi:hypothetical protein
MKSGVAEHGEQHRLTAVQGLAVLSLDALSSVAYGPEAILIVLVAAGATALRSRRDPGPGDQRGTANVVLCRLRYRLEQFAPRDTADVPAAVAAAPAAGPPHRDR